MQTDEIKKWSINRAVKSFTVQVRLAQLTPISHILAILCTVLWLFFDPFAFT